MFRNIKLFAKKIFRPVRSKRFVAKLSLMKNLMLKFCWTLFLALFCTSFVMAQNELISYKLNLVKHPFTKKYGYAFKEQNIKSPIHGTTATAINWFGKSGSVLISKTEADNIDWAIPPHYDKAASKFRENLAMVTVGGKTGFIDMYNRFIIQPTYDKTDELDGFHNGLAAVCKNGKWGFIDKQGKTIIPFEYDDADAFSEEMIAAVKQNGKWGAIDVLGKVVVPIDNKVKAAMITVPISNKAWRTASKEAKEKKNNGTFDKVLDAIHKASAATNERIANNWRQKLTYNKVGGVDSLGYKDEYERMIVPQGYEKVIIDKDDAAFLVLKDGLWGAYLYNGAKLVNPCFDTMTQFSHTKANVSALGIKGWIDMEGNLDPNLLYDMVNKGIQIEKISKLDARKIYERVLVINPEYASAYNNLALMDIENKDYNKGMRKLKLAHELVPKDSIIAKNLQWAKDSRKERRHERWMKGFEIAGAILGVATTAYSTYSSIKGGGTATAEGYSSSSSYGSSGSHRSTSVTGRCKHCAGSGTCSPTGVNRKSYCNGSGLCGYCDGTGWIAAGGDRVRCKACYLVGKCKSCKGTGKCKYCHGTGKG